MPRSQRPGIGKAVGLSWVKGDTRFLTATVMVPLRDGWAAIQLSERRDKIASSR